MQRRKFIKNGMLTMAALQITDLQALFPTNSEAIMPAMFVGHGNPLNAIEDNEFSRNWSRIGAQLPAPKAILCISAHWLTRGSFVAATPKPETIYDFSGFPDELYQVNYAAPGSPEFAQEVKSAVKSKSISDDHSWGLDHGCWSVLNQMFPKADIPVFQLSIDMLAKPEEHYAIAKELAVLRSKGLLIMGSGNIVHNLRTMQWADTAYDWAVEFDALSKSLLEKGDHDSLIKFRTLGKAADLSIPTTEHYLPLLYSIGLQQPKDQLRFFNEKTTAGSVSMRSFVLDQSV
jgi:4,5-DOPA dioxygenase extradiol